MDFIWIYNYNMYDIICFKDKIQKRYCIFILLTIMYIYLCYVLKYTQFPIYASQTFRSMIGLHAWKNLNLVPLFNLTMEDLETSFLNVLMTIPFGFGLPFITKSSFKKIAIAGLLIGVIIESLQGIIALLNGFSDRVVDLNDVIFNF